jgi:hypothetical protein
MPWPWRLESRRDGPVVVRRSRNIGKTPQDKIPAAPAERVQHDLHEVRCACGRPHVADRPAGVPDSALSVGPWLRALAVYLVVFQHVPVERCQQLIAEVTGAAVSAGSRTLQLPEPNLAHRTHVRSLHRPVRPELRRPDERIGLVASGTSEEASQG